MASIHPSAKRCRARGTGASPHTTCVGAATAPAPWVPALPIVNVGDRVLGGQTIAEAQGVMSVPVHAPTSGTVTAIEARPIAHASGLQDQCIVIETDGQDEWLSFTGITEWRALDAAALVSTCVQPALRAWAEQDFHRRKTKPWAHATDRDAAGQRHRV
ncbi:MAG: hypothetical protein CM15mP92_1060 [Halieaceae bacterium]|nr:MAG: hypothetical protein CM15mP92_1060 [Halieaceae bacterium]